MRSKHSVFPGPMAGLFALLCGLPLVATGDPPDPADPNVQVPRAVYRSVFDDTGVSDEGPAPRPLPWKRLFKPDGSFVPEDSLDAGAERDNEKAMPETVPMPPPAQAMGPRDGSGSDARGVVKAIDRDRVRVKLKHGPIDKLGMPGMTMMFRVADPSLLDTVQADEEVGFTIEQRGRAFVVTGFQTAESSTPVQSPGATAAGQGNSDARGMVKAIDRERVRVKLKHGPIDRLEMPGMTMMFRVSDPSLLDTIQEGEDVGFTIERQGSAFVITGFQR